MTQQRKRFCDFGPFRLDRQKRLLSEDSETLTLAPKAFEVLLFLMDNRGRVIEKSEFMKAIWPDTFGFATPAERTPGCLFCDPSCGPCGGYSPLLAALLRATNSR